MQLITRTFCAVFKGVEVKLTADYDISYGGAIAWIGLSNTYTRYAWVGIGNDRVPAARGRMKERHVAFTSLTNFTIDGHPVDAEDAEYELLTEANLVSLRAQVPVGAIV